LAAFSAVGGRAFGVMDLVAWSIACELIVVDWLVAWLLARPVANRLIRRQNKSTGP
jgi:hypothetical protein